jgi:hypothetical protein
MTFLISNMRASKVVAPLRRWPVAVGATALAARRTLQQGDNFGLAKLSTVHSGIPEFKSEALWGAER